MAKVQDRPCEREWGAAKAAGVVALVEKLTGGPCPCDRGIPCPLLPGSREGSRVPA